MSDMTQRPADFNEEGLIESVAQLEFAANVRRAGRSEPVPLPELRAQLRAISRPQASLARVRRLAWAVPALAVAFAGFWFFGRPQSPTGPPRMVWAQSAQIEEALVSSADEAASWAEKRTGLPKLVIKLWDGTVPYRMTAGKNWVTYHLLICDRDYKVTVTKEPERMPDAPFTVLSQSVTGYEVADGYVWDRSGISYYVQGVDRTFRTRVAATVAGLIPKAKC